MRIVILLMVGSFLVGCASQKVKLTRVDKGMSEDQVLEVMGTPNDRTFQGKEQRWIYPSSEEGVEKVVIFEDGKVVELLNAKKGADVMHGAKRAAAGAAKHCGGENQWGRYVKGGGCNMYGCWPAGGYCNGFGCSSRGRCTVRGCPNKIESQQCSD